MKPKRLRTILLSALTALLAGAPGARAADEDGPAVYDNSVEAGIGWSSEGSGKFGEWNGVSGRGAYAIGAFQLNSNPAWDGDSRDRWSISGHDLGLDPSLSGTYSRQGLFKLHINYDEITHRRFDDGRTPFVGVGTSSLTLPSGWVGATSTQAMTLLNASLRNVDIETERKRLSGGLEFIPAPGWDLSAKYRHETKEGLDALFVEFGSNGGNPSAMQIPDLIDYETNEVELSAGYGNRTAQVRVNYQLSLFDNRNPGTMFQNPYSAQFSGGAWTAGSGFPTGRGQVAGYPDNMAHNFSLSGGYNLTDTTRLTANVHYSHMTQDQRFLPYSANSLLTVSTPLPRTSLQGEVNRLVIDLGGTARPMRNLDLRASFRYQNMDDQTPQDVFVRIVGDVQNQPVGIANSNARINPVYGFRQHKFKLDGGYRVTSHAKVSLGYEFDQRLRDDVDVTKTREHTAKIKLSGSPMDAVSGWVQYARSWRNGSAYIGNAGFLATHTPEYLATLAAGSQFENDPRMRRFWLTDRDRNAVKGRINFQASDTVALGFDAGYTKDDYNDPAVGLQDQRRLSLTGDVSWVPLDALQLSAFASYDNYKQQQLGCSWSPFSLSCINTPPALAQTWSAEVDDDVYTVGFRANWAAIKHKLDVGADFSFSKSITTIDVAAGTAIGPAAPFPHDITSRLFGVGINADYHVRKDLSVRVGWRYQQLSTHDWALDDVGPSTIGRVLSLGTTSPDYSAHLVGVAVKYQF